MDKCRIFLSGAMSGLSFEEQSKWRNQIMNAIKFENHDLGKIPLFFNPVNYYNFEEKQHKTEKEVMEYDLHNLRKSDLVIVNFNDPWSIGTAMELMLAKEMKIPVVGINTCDKELHPWLLECVNRMCNSTRECVDYVIDFYLNY